MSGYLISFALNLMTRDNIDLLNNRSHIYSPLVQSLEVMVTILTGSDLLYGEHKPCMQGVSTPT